MSELFASFEKKMNLRSYKSDGNLFLLLKLKLKWTVHFDNDFWFARVYWIQALLALCTILEAVNESAKLRIRRKNNFLMRVLLSLSQMDFDDCSTITALGNRMVWILRLTIKMTMKIKNRKEYKIALSFVTGVGMRLECFKMYLKRTQGKDPLLK